MRGREVQLDVVRGLAIILAMGWHLNSGTMQSGLTDILLAPGRVVGWAGVDLFFVLSGFLVGGLVLREVAETRSFDYGRFLVRRAFRLWPVLYVYLAAQVVMTDRPLSSYLPQVVLHIQNFWQTPLHHLWSLAVEEQFYLLVGLAIPLALSRRLRSRQIAVSLIALIAVTAILRPLAYLGGVEPGSIQIQTEFRLDGLAFGVLLALLQRRYPAQYAQLSRRRRLNLSVALIAFVALWFLPTPAERAVLGYTVAAVGSAFALLAAHRAPGALWTTAPIRFIAWLGLCSYPMYIWHNGVGNQITPKISSILHIASPDIVVLLKYLFSIGWAYVMVLLVERPFMRLRDRRFSARTPQEAAASPAAVANT